MRKIILFTNVSLDGYFEAPGHDLSWASNNSEAFSSGGSGEVDTFLLGHRSYEVIKGFWSTPQAAEMAPEMARKLTESPKIAASRQGFDPGWQNATVISGDVVGEVRKIKAQPGGDMLMFGSNELCVSLMQAGLVDEFQILVNPVALGDGTPLFKGLPEWVRLTLTDMRRLQSGTVVLVYRPAEG